MTALFASLLVLAFVGTSLASVSFNFWDGPNKWYEYSYIGAPLPSAGQTSVWMYGKVSTYPPPVGVEWYDLIRGDSPVPANETEAHSTLTSPVVKASTTATRVALYVAQENARGSFNKSAQLWAYRYAKSAVDDQSAKVLLWEAESPVTGWVKIDALVPAELGDFYLQFFFAIQAKPQFAAIAGLTTNSTGLAVPHTVETPNAPAAVASTEKSAPSVTFNFWEGPHKWFEYSYIGAPLPSPGQTSVWMYGKISNQPPPAGIESYDFIRGDSPVPANETQAHVTLTSPVVKMSTAGSKVLLFVAQANARGVYNASAQLFAYRYAKTSSDGALSKVLLWQTEGPVAGWVKVDAVVPAELGDFYLQFFFAIQHKPQFAAIAQLSVASTGLAEPTTAAPVTTPISVLPSVGPTTVSPTVPSTATVPQAPLSTTGQLMTSKAPQPIPQPSSLPRKVQVTNLLKAIETGAPEAFTVINPNHYIQHNPAASEGLDGVQALMALLNGTARVRTVRVFQDGDYVFAHTDYNFFGPKYGFDIFRFENGLIVEHWDNLQVKPVRLVNPSGHSMIDGPTIVDTTALSQTGANKALVRRFIEDIFIEDFPRNIQGFFNRDKFIQHNPEISDGLSGLRIAMKAGKVAKYSKVHMVLGEGNFVLAVSEGTKGTAHVAIYDLFRTINGKLAEHWDVIESIPAADQWLNQNGKF